MTLENTETRFVPAEIVPPNGEHLLVGDDEDTAVAPSEEETTALRREGFLRLLEEHSQRPPGGDVYNAAFYTALADIVAQDPTLIDMMIAAQDIRSQPDVMRPMTKVSMLNLMQHAINEIMIFKRGQQNFPKTPSLRLNTVSGWRDLLTDTIVDQYDRDIMQTFVEKDIQTTDVRRGVAYPLIAGRNFKDRPDYQERGIRVLDLGSSANWIWGYHANKDYAARNPRPGLRGKLQREPADPFAAIVDESDDIYLQGIIGEHAGERIPVRQQIAIDRTDPLATEEARKWFLSCRHFGEVSTKELSKTKEQMYDYRQGAPTVEYVRGDYLHLPFYPANPTEEEVAQHGWSDEQVEEVRRQRSMDMITASMTFYILPKELRDRMITDMLERLNPDDGILVITDYCSVDVTGKLIFTKKRDPYSCKTVVRGPKTGDKWVEICEYENTRAKKLRARQGLGDFMYMTGGPDLTAAA